MSRQPRPDVIDGSLTRRVPVPRARYNVRNRDLRRPTWSVAGTRGYERSRGSAIVPFHRYLTCPDDTHDRVVLGHCTSLQRCAHQHYGLPTRQVALSHNRATPAFDAAVRQRHAVAGVRRGCRRHVVRAASACCLGDSGCRPAARPRAALARAAGNTGGTAHSIRSRHSAAGAGVTTAPVRDLHLWRALGIGVDLEPGSTANRCSHG